MKAPSLVANIFEAASEGSRVIDRTSTSQDRTVGTGPLVGGSTNGVPLGRFELDVRDGKACAENTRIRSGERNVVVAVRRSNEEQLSPISPGQT